ncbi:MAG TPA: DUF111 family protein, partial [Spirochaetales bacterium]|nr:DUF111 family protein [Spirochaetales bacterium]
MKESILYYDCFSGISGDMNLSALVGLGVPEDHLRAELEKLGLDGWSLRLTRDSKHGIFGLRADVELAGHEHNHEHAHEHNYEHGHEHAHKHGHEHAHEHNHEHEHDHEH